MAKKDLNRQNSTAQEQKSSKVASRQILDKDNMYKNKLYIDFEAYERVAEPHKRERASAWRTAIGLQEWMA